MRQALFYSWRGDVTETVLIGTEALGRGRGWWDLMWTMTIGKDEVLAVEVDNADNSQIYFCDHCNNNVAT